MKFALSPPGRVRTHIYLHNDTITSPKPDLNRHYRYKPYAVAHLLGGGK